MEQQIEQCREANNQRQAEADRVTQLQVQKSALERERAGYQNVINMKDGDINRLTSMVNDLNIRLAANPPQERRTQFRSTPILDDSNLNPTQVDGAIFTPDTTVHLSQELPPMGQTQREENVHRHNIPTEIRDQVYQDPPRRDNREPVRNPPPQRSASPLRQREPERRCRDSRPPEREPEYMDDFDFGEEEEYWEDDISDIPQTYQTYFERNRDFQGYLDPRQAAIVRQATCYRENRPLLERAQQRHERQSRARSQPPMGRGRSSSRANRYDSQNPPPFVTGGNAQRMPQMGQLSNQELGFYQRLPPPWNVCPYAEAIKTSDLEKIIRGHEFKDGYLAYRTFRTWFIRRVHSTFNTIGEKCEVLAACIKSQPSVMVLAETQRGDTISYRMMIHELEKEFGNPHKHQSNFISDVESWTTIKYYDLIKLQQASQRIRAYLSDRLADRCGISEGEVRAEYAAIFRKMDHLMIMKWDDWRGNRERKPDLWALAEFFDNVRSNQQDGITRQPRKAGGASTVTFLDGVEVINDTQENLREGERLDDTYQSSGDKSSTSGDYDLQYEERQSNRVMSGNSSRPDTRQDRRDDSNSRQNRRGESNSSKGQDNRQSGDNRSRKTETPWGDRDRDRDRRNDRSRSRSPSPYIRQEPFCHVCPKPVVPHWTKYCVKFALLTYAQKMNIVKKHEMCPRCLVPGHKLEDCKSKSPCQTCASLDHHSLIHNPESDSEKPKGEASGNSHKSFVGGVFNTVKKEVEGTEYAPITQIYALRVIAVKLTGPTKKSVVVNALLDDGSNRTLIDKSLAKHLELVHDTPIQLNLEGVSGLVCLENNSHIVKMGIEALDGSHKDEIKAATLRNPVGDLKSYRWNTFKKLWSHIENLEFPDNPGANCHLLLGSDYNHLLASKRN